MHQLEIKVLDIIDARCNHEVTNFISESVRVNQKRANKIFLKSEKYKRAQLVQDR